MNEELKKEAKEKLEWIVKSGEVEMEDAPSQFLALLGDTIDRATLAERKRILKIVNKHQCDWGTGCLDENSDGDVGLTGNCQNAIATAIEKGEV